MKKKLAIIIIILLASGGITWAILNQSKDSKQQTAPLTKESSQKPKIPGGEKIIDQDSSTKDQLSKELSKNQGQKQPDSSSRSTHDNQHNSQHSQQSSQKPSAPNSHTQAPAQPLPQNPSQPLTPPIKPPKPNTPPTQPQPPVTPPVTPPTPPQPPITPPQPPKPPKPPVTPPQQNLSDEEKARKIINDLKSSTNQNVAQFTNDDNQIRTVLWTKGIAAPRLGTGGDFRRAEDKTVAGTYVYYYVPFESRFLNSGWYDVDKSNTNNQNDLNMCFGAVAANQLHWWLKNNNSRVNQFLQRTNYANTLASNLHGSLRDLRIYPNSFQNQQNSRLFNMFTVYFNHNIEGYQADPLIDMFINGYRPKPGGGTNDPDWPDGYIADNRGGFFHQVFDREILTRRMTTLSFDAFSRELKTALRDGKSVAIIHTAAKTYNHVITAWGAEYDLNGKLVGVYVTDSDDQHANFNGMKRYGVNNINGKAVLTTNVTNPSQGPRVDSISTLGLGEDKWNNFLK